MTGEKTDHLKIRERFQWEFNPVRVEKFRVFLRDFTWDGMHRMIHAGFGEKVPQIRDAVIKSNQVKYPKAIFRALKHNRYCQKI